MGDLFDERVPEEWICRIWCAMGEFYDKHEKRVDAYHMGHTYFMLTKQIRRMVGFCCSRYPEGWQRKNVYHGVSITGPDDLWMVEELLKVPGKHWVSIEPCISQINIAKYLSGGTNHDKQRTGIHDQKYMEASSISWIILGCESGPKRRPMPLQWAVDVVNQCKAAGVPVYCKQLSIGNKVVHDINLFPKELQIRELPNAL